MAFGKFLVGVAKGMDLDPMVDMYAKAHRRREDRKEKIEDRDYADLRDARNLGAQHGVTNLGPDATSADYVNAVGEMRSPAGQLESAAHGLGISVDQYKKDLGATADLGRKERDSDAAKLEPDYVDPAVIEARRAKQKEDERQRKAAAREFGRDITNGRGQIDPLKEEEFLAEVAKERELKNAVLELTRAGVSQAEINNRKTFIKDEIPTYKRELDFYTQSASSPEGLIGGKSIPKMDAIRASIKRMEAGDSTEKIAKIRNDMTRLRETMVGEAAGPEGGIYGDFKKSEGERAQGEEAALRQERVKDWRGDDSQSIDWLGGERPKASTDPLTPGQSPIAPGTSPLLVNPGATATPPPEETSTTTPPPELGTQKPPPVATTVPDTVATTVPDTVATAPDATVTPTPGATPILGAVKPPADPSDRSAVDEEKAQAIMEKTLGQRRREQDAAQPRPENIMLTPEELQERYANTDLSIQERFYNPGSLRISSLAEGQGFGWQGVVGVGGKNFAQFDSPKAGMDALKQQLRIDRDRKKEDGSPLTVGDFVKKYVGESADPEGTKKALINYPKLLGKNAPNGLDTNIKDIEFQAFLKTVMTNENHSADSLSVFQRYMEDTPLDPSTQVPGVNPIMEGGGGLGDKAVDVTAMDPDALMEGILSGAIDWDTLSSKDKALIKKNNPNIHSAMTGN